MKKHSVEKFLKSIFRTHDQVENSEAHLDEKDAKQIEERILKLIKAEDDTKLPGDSLDRSEVTSLINDFYEHYKHICGRYDDLIGKLKAHKKGENGNLNSSSDSESSDSDSNTVRKDQAELEAEKSTEENRNGVRRMETEISKLKIENSILKQGLDRAALQVANLNQQLVAITEEKEVSFVENLILVSKIKEAQKSLDELREEANNNLKLATKVLSCENTELIQTLAAVREENNGLKLDILRSSSQVQETEKTVKDLKDQINELVDIKSDLNQQLKVKDDETSALASQHLNSEEKLGRAMEKMEILTEEIEKKKDANSRLSLNCEDLKSELEARNEEVISLKGSLAARILELSSNIEQLENEKERLRADNSQLIIKITDLGDENSNTVQKLRDSEKTIDDLERRMEEAQIEWCAQMKAKKKEASDLQVQIRLSNQKLKVTETEHNETVKSYRKSVEALEEECTDLKAQVVALSGGSERLKAELKQTTDSVIPGMRKLIGEIHELGLGFDKNYEHIMTKLSLCVKDIDMVKTHLEDRRHEEQELINEHVVVLRAKLAEKEEELGELTARAAESEKKRVETEKMAMAKEEEVLVKDEEKREVIRQLCLMIEYHRESCDTLYRKLSAKKSWR